MIAEIRLVAQLALGIVFALSAVGKLRDPTGFTRGVADYQILPVWLAHPVGFLIIGLEVCLAIAHLTGWLVADAAPLGFGMLMSFGVAVGVNLRRGRALPCHCFGSQNGESISARTLGRLVLLLACELLVLSDPSLFVSNQLIYPGRFVSISQLALAFFWATFLLMVGSWILSVRDLMDLFRRAKHGLHEP
jgi:hypothetical protein